MLIVERKKLKDASDSSVTIWYDLVLVLGQLVECLPSPRAWCLFLSQSAPDSVLGHVVEHGG